MPETSLAHKLQAAGGRVTPQRQFIINLLQDQDGHLSADEIYTLARQRRASLSLATVYRTLGWLEKSGLVRGLRLKDARCYYEIERGTAHQHMICLLCGQVIEFECARYLDALDAPADQHSFQITSARVKLLGYCADCQARMHNEK